MNNHIQLYTSADGKISLQVSLDNETVWLTQAQMASLFGVKVQNITMHLKNVYVEQELDENSTCKDFLHVQTEGERTVLVNENTTTLMRLFLLAIELALSEQHNSANGQLKP